MRRYQPDIAIIALYFLLPLMLFWGQTIGGKTLLPAENLYQYEPYASYSEVVSAPEQPHNHLLSDLVLQNYHWKAFTKSQIAQGEIPLWNPHQFSGIPFLAAGQQSALYPLSILYYALPLTAAYGWFTVVNLWLAGAFMYAYLRGIGVSRSGGALGGVVYQLCGFFIASVVFPMIIGAAVWLPLLLLMVEFIIRQQNLLGRRSILPWVAVGALALGFNIFAGHVELTIYTLLIIGVYAAARLLWELWAGYQTQRKIPLGQTVLSGFWLALMIALGFGLGSVQFIPLFEFVQTNWRAERSDLNTVLSYAHPTRDVIQFLMPNFYGSPTHQSYFDIFSGQTVTDLRNAAGAPIPFIDWGIKNYVEGALYVGILPLLLAAYSILHGLSVRVPHKHDEQTPPPPPPYRLIFGGMTALALTFMFGLPTYALVYALPGINQLNSPFRWVYAVTIGVAVLAALGWDILTKSDQSDDEANKQALNESPLRGLFSVACIGGGVLILAGLLFSYLFIDSIVLSIEQTLLDLALASNTFSDGRMFVSFQFPHLLILAVMLLIAGAVFRLARRFRDKLAFSGVVVAVVAVDLMIATGGFNPASDPALLDFTPPAFEWMIEQREEEPYRYTTLQNPERIPLLQANMTWRYGLDDIRGYESIIPKQYMDYMGGVAPQVQRDFNRVAPLYTAESFNHFGGYALALDHPLLDLLNVRYVVTHHDTIIPFQEWELVYTDEAVAIWENDSALPRAYTVPQSVAAELYWQTEGDWDYAQIRAPETYTPATITHDTGREKFVDVQLDEASWLVISETWMPGWRAFVRPLGGAENEETAYPVELVLGNFQGVELPAGDFTVRLVYSPASFQVGVFGTIISLMLITFLLGVWFWRAYVGVNTDDSSQGARIARNSLAPIILNLFNRGIDFAFAIVMLRILSPEAVGEYYYAVVIFVWFDIFTNFGLDLFLIREVSRERERAGHFFYNTSILRLLLSVIGVPLVLGFLLVRQMSIDPQLSSEAVIAIGLLYVGLFPASLSKGMTSLFYAYEQAEKPAAIATITTINKAIFGVIALLLGYGIVGLAGVSILNNLITFAVLVYAGRALIGKITQRKPDRPLIGGMVNESFPLMLNHFLATIFFQVDVIILEALKGARVVGLYSVSYRWLLAINIIPSFFTQALFPVMSRQAQENREALRRTYDLGIKILVGLALPLAVGFTFLAEPLTFILGGQAYLPDGAIALQVMIWSIPLGWMNSLTQYVLIAVDLQRFITRAFFGAVLFNIVVNLIFIPQFSYIAAALTTIASEAVLLVGFGVLMQRALGKINWWDLVWRQGVAAIAMIVLTLILLSFIGVLFALILGSLAYGVVLLALRPLNDDEVARLLPLLPGRVRELRVVRVVLGV